MLRFDIIERPLTLVGEREITTLLPAQLDELNHSHRAVFDPYALRLIAGEKLTLSDRLNTRSNLGALRNRQMREAVILSAALAAVAVALAGRGALASTPRERLTRALVNATKRANDRAAAQVMSEVLQRTTEEMPVGEEVLIESAITEGVRAKPGKEPGGNPTIPVGALFGKADHCARYGQPMPNAVSLLSMGSDVVEGTTKSVYGDHSSLAAVFVTEANVKRHLPDVYVQRWMAGASFPRFNPRSTSVCDSAEIIASAYDLRGIEELSAFFLKRPRHEVPMDQLNGRGTRTPYDQDGDLLPAVVLGLDCLRFPDGGGLNAMIGEIGGSAEWAIAVLPLVWRGGQALGMFTSQSALSRKGVDPTTLWNERYSFSEDEFILMQDARFERKPVFTVEDILDDPFAGGISAFGAITDNLYVPFLRGVRVDEGSDTIDVSVLVVDSLGHARCWRLRFQAEAKLKETRRRMASPKTAIERLCGRELEQAIGRMLDDGVGRDRYRRFFGNEYYPALVPVHDKMVVLHRVVKGLAERGVIDGQDLEIIGVTERIAGEDWFVHSS